MADITVMGAGSWGCALTMLLLDNGHRVTLWSIDPEEVDMIREYREQKIKLPGVILEGDLAVTTDLKEAAIGRDVIVMAVPSAFTRKTARSIAPYLKNGQLIVDVAKGIEDETLKTLSEQIEDEIPGAEVVVLSGPSHAEEVGRKMPTAVVVGARNKDTALYVQSLFMNHYFRVYTSPDVKGIELGGSLKNVIALAAGMADGLGYGDNTKAALITRGMKELSAIGEKAGGHRESFMGLTGMGDLIVTCASVHSRNRRAGYLMGQGYTKDEAMKEVHMVVEGVYSARAAMALAEKYGLEVPIIREVNEILFDGKKVTEAMMDLMVRKGKTESPVIPWEG